MVPVLVAYAVLMLLVGLFHARKIRGFREYVIAGGRQGTGLITLSLLASIVGGSATMGITDMAADMGFPAFWWLGVGSVGLLLQAWLLSARVRGLAACTLPDVANITVGGEARALTALIIAVTWTGIVAAQFTALSQIFAVMTGLSDTRILLILISLVVIAYTAGGGQLSVLRTDAIQFLLVFGGVAAACVALWAGDDSGAGAWLSRLELFNERFGWRDLVSLLFLVGAAYFIGPDIFSRNLSARDGATARRATLLAAFGLLAFAVPITLVGVWGGAHGLAGGENPLVVAIRHHLPAPVALLLALGLISALVSSADTCLMSAATILEHDFLRRESLGRARGFVVLVGLISLGVALLRSDIIGLLMAAYSVYAPGVVPPLFVAIMCHGRRPLNRPLWLVGVAAGGVCGFAAGLAGMPFLPLAGMALSGALAVAAAVLPSLRPGHALQRE